MKKKIYEIVSTKKLEMFSIDYNSNSIAILSEGKYYYFTLCGYAIYDEGVISCIATPNVDMGWLTEKRASRLAKSTNPLLRALNTYFSKEIPISALYDKDYFVTYCAVLRLEFKDREHLYVLRNHPHPAIRDRVAIVCPAYRRMYYSTDSDVRIRRKIVYLETQFHREIVENNEETDYVIYLLIARASKELRHKIKSNNKIVQEYIRELKIESGFKNQYVRIALILIKDVIDNTHKPIIYENYKFKIGKGLL